MALHSRHLRIFLVSLGIAVVARLFFFDNFRVVSDSMVPGLRDGDVVFSLKSAYGLRVPFSDYELVRWRRPKRGEVVAFALPGQKGATYVKRVVATEGDRVELREGRLWVNGAPARYFEESGTPVRRAREVAEEGRPPYWVELPNAKLAFGPLEVPKGHFFALGDNRQESVDSRSWGPIPYSSLRGKVLWLWFPGWGVERLNGGRGLATEVL